MNNITKIVLYLSFVILAPWLAVADPNYCDKSLCPDGGVHIGCNNNMEFSQKCPKDAKMVEMTPALQELIVDQFNKKRNFVAGGKLEGLKAACRMASMKWNADLAKMAELNVKKCEMEVDACHNTEDFPYSGQNIALLAFYGDTPDDTLKITQAINKWYSESKSIKLATIEHYPAKFNLVMTGHFAAMVADRSYAIGCAASHYPVDSKTYRAYLLTCNFAFTNMVDSPVYRSCTKPASKCMGEDSKYQNLCDSTEEYIVDGF